MEAVAAELQCLNPEPARQRIMMVAVIVPDKVIQVGIVAEVAVELIPFVDDRQRRGLLLHIPPAQAHLNGHHEITEELRLPVGFHPGMLWQKSESNL